MVEVASFRTDDCDALVAASLACPLCLSGAVDWRLTAEQYDQRIACRCRHCGHVRTVFVTDGQALRLALAPVGS